MELSGFDKANKTICLIFNNRALNEKLEHQICADMNKLKLLEEQQKESFHKIFCFSSAEIETKLATKSWLSEPLKDAGVQFISF